MNSNVTSTVISMGAEEFKNLTNEVKETVASSNFVSKHDKSFGVADLWNIQRNRKTQNLSGRAMLSRRNTIV